MKRHAIQFTQLVDWVDGRLEEDAKRHVESHLAAGCLQCQREVNWLQRVLGAARDEQSLEPPPELVVEAKAVYRRRWQAPAYVVQRRPVLALPRFAFGLAMLALVVAVTFLLLSQTPTLFVRQATVTALAGRAQVRLAGEVQWSDVQAGARLTEGDQIRVIDGALVVDLFDGSTLKMEATSELALASLRSGLFNASRRVAVTQQAGSVDYDVARLSGPLSSFEAAAPTVRVAVQGTRFVIAVHTAEETEVSVLQGSVLLVNELQSTVLAEREVAIVPANAPVVRLPTLLPTETPLPAVTFASTQRKAVTSAAPITETVTPPAPILPTAQDEPAQQATPTVESGLSAVPSPTPATDALARTPHPTRTPGPSQTPRPSATGTLSEKQTATPTAGGTRRPTAILGEIVFRGKIESFPPDLVGVWQVGGRSVLAIPATRVLGQPAIGLWANVVFGLPGPTDRIDALPVARLITIERQLPGQTLEPTAIRTQLPSAFPRATHTATPTLPLGAVETPTPSRTLVPTVPGTPTGTPVPRETVTPRDTRRATHTPLPTWTLRASHTPLPGHTPQPTRIPRFTLTPEPTLTAPAAETPQEPRVVHFLGVIERLPPQRVGAWVIGGRVVTVVPETKIEGEPVVGHLAEVEAREHPNGMLQATRISMVPTTTSG